MVRTASTMLPLGSLAPDFSLQNVDGKTVSRNDFQGKPGLLVVFMCNHCPFVLHLRSQLAAFAREYMDKGLAVVGISSNDISQYPQDGPDAMKAEHAAAGIRFLTSSTRRSQSPRRIGRPARRTSSCSTGTFIWSTEASLMTVAPKRIFL